MKHYRVLVCGDRNWNEAFPIRRELTKLCGDAEVDVVIHGAARGADTIGGTIAAALGIPVISVPAEWSRFGLGAGPKRNQKMLDKHKPNLVLAFHKDITKSKGTKDMVNKARKAGVEVRIISS